MRLADVTGTSQQPVYTVMNQIYKPNDSGDYIATKPVASDNKQINPVSNHKPYVPVCNGKVCLDPNMYLDETTCTCKYQAPLTSPIVIDVDGSGSKLTNRENGVYFDVRNNGTRILVTWTAPNSTTVFLALDRHGNGTVDNGAELFGEITPQPPSDTPNGYLTLAVYDDNRDGVD